MYVGAMFDDTRTVLADPNENLYGDALLVAYYNRIQEEIAAILRQHGAEIAMSSGTITGDGSAQSYVLPTDFLAFVPSTFLPRSPITATSNYSHGAPLLHVDPMDRRFMTTPTAASSPTMFCLTTSGTSQYVKFNTIPTSGHLYDYHYWPTITKVAVGASLDTTSTPWLGLLDQLFSRSLEEYCREGKEFTTEHRALWRARAEADCVSLLGLRHLKVQQPNPSLWRGFPW